MRTYPTGWFGTPAPAVTAMKAPAAAATGTATAAPTGERVTPAAAKATAAEGAVAETPKKVPGFTVVFVIAGLLTVAYAMVRRRR